jgi:hypothetical protein
MRIQKAFRASLAALVILWVPAAHAGGPLMVGTDGRPFVWSTSAPVAYRTDGGKLGPLTNEDANARVAAMFAAWSGVSTAAVSFTRAGAIQGGDGDVNTLSELDAAEASCRSGSQTPIIYDENGSLFEDIFGSGS